MLQTSLSILDELLSVVQDHWLQADIPRRVDTMDVPKGSSHGEVPVGHGGQGLIDLPDLDPKRSQLNKSINECP